MPPPENPYKPYASAHENIEGPGDARPTALQVVKDCDAVGKLEGRNILITGCSSGIGVETARALYETGATLFLAARDIPKLEKVIDDIVSKAECKAGPRPVPIKIHLESLEGVRKGAEEFKSKCNGQLSILIENAGIMACPYGKTADGFETHIGTNHMAHFLLFQLLKPMLLHTAKETGTTSRVIVVSSAGHRTGGIRFDDMHWEKDPTKYSKFGAYGQSKTANIYMANSISRHYSAQGLTGLSVHPGGIMTELGRHLDEEDMKYFGDFNKLMKTFKSPEQGAATQVWAAVSPHFEDVKNGGQYLVDVGEASPMSANPKVAESGYKEHAYNEEAEEKLWEISCDAVGVPVKG